MSAIAAGEGKINVPSVALIITSGFISAAKDYRSSMRFPPVDSDKPIDVPINKPK